jgi:hypothetical protein
MENSYPETVLAAGSVMVFAVAELDSSISRPLEKSPLTTE